MTEHFKDVVNKVYIKILTSNCWNFVFGHNFASPELMVTRRRLLKQLLLMTLLGLAHVADPRPSFFRPTKTA